MTQALSIRAESLVKSFRLGMGRRKRVIDQLSLTIGEGERIGIIGGNGAGKTTLLQMVAGIAAPTSGVLEVQGKVTAVFTLGIGLREDLSGRDNIYIDGELHGRTRAQTEAMMQEIVDFADLGAFMDRPVRTYSTGMKARLAFSMLVHIDPEILIVDEALSVGDANFAAKATAKMQELAKRGRILIVVSHSMAAIEAMCNRCLWLDQGVIRMDGAPEVVTQAYLESVRQAGDVRQRTLFNAQCVGESFRQGWEVAAFDFADAESGESLATLQTGVQTRLNVQAKLPAGAECYASLRIARLDHIAVLQQDSPPLRANTHGELSLVIGLGAMPLNYGLYSVVLSLHGADGACYAKRTQCVEVVNVNPPRGGRPLLVSPVVMESEKSA